MAGSDDALIEAARAAAAEQIAEGLGAILRKFCDSDAAHKARNYLHAMPPGDWRTLIDMLAEETADAVLSAARAHDAEAPLASAADRIERLEAEVALLKEDGAYDRGRRDVLNALLDLNPPVAAKLAALREREADPAGRLPFDMVFWVTSVAEQLGIEPKEAALFGDPS